MQHLRGVEPQQMADRDGGGQGPTVAVVWKIL